ncbi:MAG: hypothetical protein ACOZFS_00025 [Thermodesulfobacteriota bacterium]
MHPGAEHRRPALEFFPSPFHPQYTMVDLSISGAYYTLPQSINNAGQVVGYYSTETNGSDTKAFSYQNGSYAFPGPPFSFRQLRYIFSLFMPASGV